MANITEEITDVKRTDPVVNSIINERVDILVNNDIAINEELEEHIGKNVASNNGAHGLRYYNSELDYYDETNERWVKIETGGGGGGGVGKEGDGTGAEIFNLYENIQESNANDANGDYSHAEGMGTIANGIASHAEGFHTTANTSYSHVEGQGTTASGVNAHAEGGGTQANGQNAHAEGNNTYANGNNSHTEGNGNRALGLHSHAEGNGNVATSWGAHAEGDSNVSSGENSHTEGSGNTASGNNSHAGGYDTQAVGAQSFVHGLGLRTTTYDPNQAVFGRYNDETENPSSLFKIGNGTDDNNRSNIVAVDDSSVNVNGYLYADNVLAPNLVTLDNKDTLTANKQLSNIENTTITDVKNREKQLGDCVLANTNYSYVDGKYIWFEEDNNTVYTCISNDGLTLTSRKANNLVVGEYSDNIFVKNSVSGVYIICGELLSTSPGDATIHYSTDLINWTRVILPGSLGNGTYYIDTSSPNGYWGYEFKGRTYLYIHLYEEIEGSPYQNTPIILMSTTDGTSWTIHTDTNIENYGQQPVYIDNDIIIGDRVKSTDGLNWVDFNVEQLMQVFLVNKVESTYYLLCRHGMSFSNRIYSTTDFSTFNLELNLTSEIQPKFHKYATYFEDAADARYSLFVRVCNDNYVFFSSTRADNVIYAAYLTIPTDLDVSKAEWVDIPLTISDSDYSYQWNLFADNRFTNYSLSNDIRVYNTYDNKAYGLLELSAFTHEVSKALDILGVSRLSYTDVTSQIASGIDISNITGVLIIGEWYDSNNNKHWLFSGAYPAALLTNDNILNVCDDHSNVYINVAVNNNLVTFSRNSQSSADRNIYKVFTY